LILEYCGGGSLEEYMLKKGPLSEEETLHWLHELGIYSPSSLISANMNIQALGLKFLHDRSILHRDLKVQYHETKLIFDLKLSFCPLIAWQSSFDSRFAHSKPQDHRFHVIHHLIIGTFSFLT